MKTSTYKFITAIMLSTVSNIAFAECDEPGTPIVTDGKVASMDELVSAQKAIKIYQTSLGEYRDCLKGMESAIDLEAEGSAEKSAAILTSYNASVDSESLIAEEFNTAVQAFKARQPAEEAAAE